MAEFAEVSRQWTRMCKTMDTLYGDKCCDICSLGGCNAVYEQDGTEDYAEIERKVMAWAKENPEPVYPTWGDWLSDQGVLVCDESYPNMRYWYAINKKENRAANPCRHCSEVGT